MILSLYPATNLLNCAQRGRSSSGFLMGPVFAGGAHLPPLPPLSLPGVLVPQRVVADNLHLLIETLLNRVVDWSTDQSFRVVGRLNFLPKMLACLGLLQI